MAQEIGVNFQHPDLLSACPRVFWVTNNTAPFTSVTTCKKRLLPAPRRVTLVFAIYITQGEKQMSVTVTRISNEPIFHALFTGTVIEQDLLDMFEQSLEMAQVVPEPHIYRITESRSADIAFTQIMYVLDSMSNGRAGSSTDPRFKPVLVGDDDNMRTIAEATHQEQYGNMNLPLFTSFEDALAYVRETITATS